MTSQFKYPFVRVPGYICNRSTDNTQSISIIRKGNSINNARGYTNNQMQNKQNTFGLVCLFNGISTFVGYLMPKLVS